MIIKGELPDVFTIKPLKHEDHRGAFVKIYQSSLFESYGVSFTPVEQFFSVSETNVLRGMHFQNPPHAHNKLVHCVFGEVLDVVLDLRLSSPTYGKTHSELLNDRDYKAIFVPKGCAHGFLSLKANSCVIYQTDSEYSAAHDTGVHYNSFGFKWPESRKSVSPRDMNFPELAHFSSHFK